MTKHKLEAKSRWATSLSPDIEITTAHQQTRAQRRKSVDPFDPICSQANSMSHPISIPVVQRKFNHDSIFSPESIQLKKNTPPLRFSSSPSSSSFFFILIAVSRPYASLSLSGGISSVFAAERIYASISIILRNQRMMTAKPPLWEKPCTLPRNFWPGKNPSYPNNALVDIFHSLPDQCKRLVIEASTHTNDLYSGAIVLGADVGGGVGWCLYGVGEEERERGYSRGFGEEDMYYLWNVRRRKDAREEMAIVVLR
jgi:hypothetical protein